MNGSRLPTIRLQMSILIVVAILVAVMLAGVGSTPAHARGGDARAVAASCAVSTHDQEFRSARLVFDGTMLAGPSVQFGGGSRRVLTSPARVRVTRYLKGHGPRTVKIQTALTRTASGIVGNSEGLLPTAGQHWRIYATGQHQPLPTSDCDGSRPLR